MSKKSKYFKSKKGFSLVELLCAVVIMALVVSATATGLAVSFQSIMIGSAKDKASAKAQEYCDIIMTYVQNTPAHDPSQALPFSVDPDKNLLFDTTKGANCMFKNDPLADDVMDLLTAPGVIPDIIQLENPTAVSSHIKNDAVPYFIVEKNGEYNNGGEQYVSYQITAYVDYGNGEYTTYCTGSVTKPKYVS